MICRTSGKVKHYKFHDRNKICLSLSVTLRVGGGWPLFRNPFLDRRLEFETKSISFSKIRSLFETFDIDTLQARVSKLEFLHNRFFET